MDGRTVHAPILTNGESLVTIDVSQFAGGVYHIHAAFDDQEITKKLIISNN